MLMGEVLMRFDKTHGGRVSDGLERLLIAAAQEAVGAKNLPHRKVGNVDRHDLRDEARELARRRVALAANEVDALDLGSGWERLTEDANYAGLGGSVTADGVSDDVVIEHCQHRRMRSRQFVGVMVAAPQAQLFPV